MNETDSRGRLLTTYVESGVGSGEVETRYSSHRRRWDVVSIDKQRLPELLNAIFATERPEVFGAYSDYDQELETFSSPEGLEKRIAGGLRDGKKFFHYAIWYPSTGGRIEKVRIDLKSEACQGHTFRYSVGGWGIFQLQLDFKQDPVIQCRIAVNSRKRAVEWESVYHEWLAVESWSWPTVEKHERRLIRKLRSLASVPPTKKTVTGEL
jgi:hypothetical protein